MISFYFFITSCGHRIRLHYNGSLLELLWKKIKKDSTECNFCGARISTKHGSTKGLKVHLQRHPSEQQKLKKVQEDVVIAWTKENPKKRKAEDKDDEESIPRLKQPRIDELPNLNTKQGTASRWNLMMQC